MAEFDRRTPAGKAGKDSVFARQQGSSASAKDVVRIKKGHPAVHGA
jgi:siroheme synthase